MKKFNQWLSLLLILTLLVSNIGALAESDSENDTIGHSIKNFFNDAEKWAEEAADKAGTLIDETVDDAGKWITDVYGNTVQLAGDALDWTKDALGAAGNWIVGTASDAWDWTKGAANDTWIFASTTAENIWNTTTKTVSGTWNDIFGDVEDDGVRNLCISSPLFLSADKIADTISEEGSIAECFKYDGDYDITLIASSRAEETMPPSVGEIEFTDLVASCFDVIAFVDQNAEGFGVRAMAQEIRFKAIQDEVPKFGRALGVWTDNYCIAFIITTDVAVDYEDVNVEELKEADAFFDLWVDTLSIYETKEVEADVDSDILAGNLTASNVKAASRLYYEAKFHSTRGGRGFAAENANTLADNVKGIFRKQRASIIGDDNAANGADRKFTDGYGNVSLIQTKYYSNARASLNACFDADGAFRYLDADGNPMLIEVASDQYDDAITIMKQLIGDGKIPGVTDPDKAVDIVRKGTVTYKQACRIAKAGNIESIKYDAVNGCVESLYSVGISSAVEFAVSMWNGEDIETALKLSIYTGLKVGGTSFVISVLSSQLSKAGLNSLLVGSSDAVIKLIGPKAAATFVNAFRMNNIYGAAAMNSAAKLLRSNAITSAVSLVVLTVPDVVEIFRGRISGKQLAKNLVETSGGIAGGLGGWYGGAALGTMIFPGVGTVIGGIIGSVGGGFVMQIAAEKVTDLFAEDDADEMLEIVSEEFGVMAEEYMLNESEAGIIVENLSKTITAGTLKDMYSSTDQRVYAREIILRPAFNSIVENREVIEIPSDEVYQEGLIEVMEEIHDESGEQTEENSHDGE